MSEQVNHPAHYNQGEIETIDVWDSMGIGEEGCLSNVIKYAMRYRFKHDEPELQLLDLEKAAWYLNRIIENRRKRIEGDVVSSPSHASQPSIEREADTRPTHMVAGEFKNLDVRQKRFEYYAKKCKAGNFIQIYDGGMRDALRLLRPCFSDDMIMLEQIDGILDSLTV